MIDKIGLPRRINQELSSFYLDVAASTQNTLETCAISLVKYLYKLTNQKKLCISGGVGLNCSMNKKLSELNFIEDIFVQPASSDRGLSLGCAMYAANINGEKIDKIDHVFYGPKYDNNFIEKQIKISNLDYKKTDNPEKLAAKKLAEGKIIAWYHGRSEFGPRALGHRSILANPSIKNMKDQINDRIKFREEFRPFAPSVKKENLDDIFKSKIKDLDFMTIACDVKDDWIKKYQQQLTSIIVLEFKLLIKTVIQNFMN